MTVKRCLPNWFIEISAWLDPAVIYVLIKQKQGVPFYKNEQNGVQGTSRSNKLRTLHATQLSFNITYFLELKLKLLPLLLWSMSTTRLKIRINVLSSGTIGVLGWAESDYSS